MASSEALRRNDEDSTRRTLLIGGVVLVVALGGLLGYKELHKSQTPAAAPTAPPLVIPRLPKVSGGAPPLPNVSARDPFIPLAAPPVTAAPSSQPGAGSFASNPLASSASTSTTAPRISSGQTMPPTRPAASEKRRGSSPKH